MAIDLRMPTLTIEFPDTTTITMISADRTNIKELRSDMVKLQSYWLENVFSTGDTIAEAKCWKLMKTIAGLLPRQDNPAVLGFDLEAIGNDYQQLERLFFANTHSISPDELHQWELVSFDLSKFVGCDILRIHLINPKQVISDAESLRLTRSEEAKT